MTQTNITDKATRVAIIANGKYQSRRVASKLFAAFKEDKDFYLSKKDPDIVISIGGDGMLLSAFHQTPERMTRKPGKVMNHISFPAPSLFPLLVSSVPLLPIFFLSTTFLRAV